MPDYDRDVRLQRVVEDAATVQPPEDMVERCAKQLKERRQQLVNDLEYYESKCRDLESLDPLDFTGLGKIYRNHVEQIKTLLNVIRPVQ